MTNKKAPSRCSRTMPKGAMRRTASRKGCIRQTMELGWNSLCLCPNCAMKYDVCSRDITNLYEQILGRAIKEGEEDKVVLTIELNGTRQSIYYDPEHFLALKKAIQLIDDETKHK